MKKLRLPVIKDEMLGPPVLSMDEYVKFVEFSLRTFGYEDDDQNSPVGIVFKLKRSKHKNI